MNPTLSIIIPVYNVEKYLEKCFQSLIKQTFTDFELLLINDGSTDNSKEICLEYSKKDHRIIYLEKENGGLSSARNYGLDRANGKYIAFVDSDDWVELDMYEVLVDKIKFNNVDIVVCGHRVINLDGSIDEILTIDQPALYSGLEATKLILEDVKICSFAWDKIYKKELFDGLRYPEGRIFEDTPTTFKLFAKTKNVFHLNKCFYNYVRREDSICLNTVFSKVVRRNYHNYLAFQERYEFVMNNPNYSSLIDICQQKAFIHGQQQLHFIVKYRVKNESESFKTILLNLVKMKVANNNLLTNAQKVEHKLMLLPKSMYISFLKGFYFFKSRTNPVL